MSAFKWVYFDLVLKLAWNLSAKDYDQVQALLRTVEKLLQINERPEIGIICGSGLGKMADLIEVQAILPYSKVPNFPSTKGLSY